MNGAEIASKVARKFKKPLINRMGYLLSDAVEKLPEFQHFDIREINDMQNKVFRNAKKIVVVTDSFKKYRFGLAFETNGGTNCKAPLVL